MQTYKQKNKTKQINTTKTKKQNKQKNQNGLTARQHYLANIRTSIGT